MAICLTLKSSSAIPIEVESLLPCNLAHLSSLTVSRGKRNWPLADLFDIMQTNDPLIANPGSKAANGFADLIFAGPTGCLKRIGERMKSGTIRVRGDTHMHAGAYLNGGRLIIEGNTSDWLGAEMAAGEIIVHGNTGHQAGAGYRGCRRGMTGGTIHIHGNAGHELGAHMRRGMIVVHGKAGRFAAVNMIAGTIAIGGDADEGLGVGMKRGTVIVDGEEPQWHPATAYCGKMHPAYLRLLARHLKDEFQMAITAGERRLFRSDLNSLGQGEIWVR